MKILFDLQPIQTPSSNRGIGRYTWSFISNYFANTIDLTNVYVLLNDSMSSPETSEKIEFISNYIGEDHLIYCPIPKISNPSLYPDHRETKFSEKTRELLINALNPDVVFIFSLFEFEAISTIPHLNERNYKCAVILYDLIPLSQPDEYLPSYELKNWYDTRLIEFKKVDIAFSISDYVRKDAIQREILSPQKIINISTATDFKSHTDQKDDTLNSKIIDEYGQYAFYVGGYDGRKNVRKIVEAYSKLSSDVQQNLNLVLAGKLSELQELEIRSFAKQCQIPENKMFILGFVQDDDLENLLRNAHIFLFPSSNEGFGLPPLEAMCFGIPTIVSHKGSLPEVVGNPEAMFDPEDMDAFVKLFEKTTIDLDFREKLVEYATNHITRFSWNNTVNTAFQKLKEMTLSDHVGSPDTYASSFDFLSKIVHEQLDISAQDRENALTNLSDIMARGICSYKDISQHNMVAKEQKAFEIDYDLSENFMEENDIQSTPAYRANDTITKNKFHDLIPDYQSFDSPKTFSSCLCRQTHFHMPLYAYWCKIFKETPKLHRKQWEWVYICQSLLERGMLRKDMSAIGFGVGKEPLVSLFANFGVSVLATDLDLSEAAELGWVTTDQHSNALEDLNEYKICDNEQFKKLCRFQNVDMNNIPDDIGTYDFCWSSCSFEHLGSIRQGLDFVKNASRLLKPGGVSIHTTEYNLTSNIDTLDNNPSFVIFRRQDIELLKLELESEGFIVEPIDFSSGEDTLERYIDLPPYIDEPHLRLELAAIYHSTSIGIIIRKPNL